MQLELNFAVVLNSAPVQHLMVGDRVQLRGDPYSVYEVVEIAAGIASVTCIVCSPGRSIRNMNAPLVNLILLPAVETVLEQVKEQSAPEQKPHWIESYSPTNRPGYHYYRYVWMEGRKLHHKHIPGNVNGPTARRNYLEVDLAIAMKKPPCEIEQLIKSWRQNRRTK